MSRRWRTGIIGLGLHLSATAALAAAAAPAQTAALSLTQVLDSSARHYPDVVAVIAERRGAAGKLESTLGDFDLVFEVESRSRLSGFWDGRSIIATARQPLRRWGGSVYGSYELSSGEFPIYEDEYFTNTGGRLKVGMMFSLLRDRSIDARRFELTDARLALRAAELEVLMVRLGVQHRAIEAYWRWVIAGRQRAVYAELLDIALAREEALSRQVARGARAEIDLTENRRNITRRRSLSISAQAELRRAANRLSLYYRDAGGAPLIPDPEQIPPASGPQLSPAEPDPLPPALSQRPELRQLRVAAERARQRIDLSENALKPRLDLALEVAEPFGTVGPGGPSRDTTDTIVGLTLTVPLERRAARGTLQAFRAELESLRARQRGLEQRLQMEMLDLLLELDAAAQLAALASLEVEQAEALARAEQRRFDSGASDFFLINLREETAADARISALQADLRWRLARAEYDTATMNVERLGLPVDAP